MGFCKLTAEQGVLHHRNVAVFHNENTSRKVSCWDLFEYPWVRKKSCCTRIKILRSIFHWYWWTFLLFQLWMSSLALY